MDKRQLLGAVGTAIVSRMGNFTLEELEYFETKEELATAALEVVECYLSDNAEDSAASFLREILSEGD